MVFNAVVLTNALRPKARFASIIGSYGWAGKMAEMVKAALSVLKVEQLPSVIAKGLPKPADLEAIDALADMIAAKHREIGVL
jgi:flavorubredoxin